MSVVSRATWPFESTSAARTGALRGPLDPTGATSRPEPVGAEPAGHLSLVSSAPPGGIATAFDFTDLSLIFALALPGRPSRNGLGLAQTTSTVTWAARAAVTGRPRLKGQTRTPAGADLSGVAPCASVTVPLMADQPGGQVTVNVLIVFGAASTLW